MIEIRAPSLALLAILLVTSFMSVPSLAPGHEPSSKVPGDWTFPNSTLVQESSMPDLGALLGEALGLSISNQSQETGILREGPSLDAFNLTLGLQTHGWAFETSSGTTLRLHYSSETREFVAFDVQYSPRLQLGASTLRDFTVEVGDSLGIPLANATYKETISRFGRGGGNGTGTEWYVTTTGVWTQVHAYLPLYFVNQLRASVDEDTQSVIALSAFRWTAAPPPVQFSVPEVLAAASEVVNETEGPATPYEVDIGMGPNFLNGTWSFFVTWYYSHSWTPREEIVVALDVQSLEFQRVVLQQAVVSSGGGGMVIPTPALGLAAVGGFVLLVFAFAWLGQTDASWTVYLVSLGARPARAGHTCA